MKIGDNYDKKRLKLITLAAAEALEGKGVASYSKPNKALG